MHLGLILTPIIAGYVLGSIPFGYVIVRALRGIDIRDYGSHNIGATNVLRVVGWFPALLTLLGDVLKGSVPSLLAAALLTGPEVGWVSVAGSIAAIAGHAYSGFFYLLERKFARGKAVATGLGAVIGFAGSGQLPWMVVACVIGTWALAIALPRLLGRWGWVSLASVIAAITLPIATAALGAPMPFLLFGILAAAFITWKHKENLGRLLDGVEPRLGEKPPLAGVDQDKLSCAFMIHPITPEDWWQSRRFSWAVGLYRLGLLPLGVVKRLMLLVRPIKSDILHGIRVPDGREVQVYLITVPMLPDQIKAHPRLAVLRARQAAQVARLLGARCLGLGAYWSVVGGKGLEVQQAEPGLPITNGGAYTAGSVKQAVPNVFAKARAHGVDPEHSSVAVVGAGGVVGFGVCRQLVGSVRRLIMVGTDASRLEKSAALLRRRMARAGGIITEVVVTTELAACREAQIIFTATSTVEPVLLPDHVSAGTAIYDLGRPADVHPDVLHLPGVVVIPGGIIRPPGEATQRLDVHFGKGLIPACMAETILIALDECYDRASLGEGTRSENIDYFVGLAQKYGFEVLDEALVPAPPAPTVAMWAGPAKAEVLSP